MSYSTLIKLLIAVKSPVEDYDTIYKGSTDEHVKSHAEGRAFYRTFLVFYTMALLIYETPFPFTAVFYT